MTTEYIGVDLDGLTLCSYGCGRRAIVKFFPASGLKYCCENNYRHCPANKKKISDTKKEKVRLGLHVNPFRGKTHSEESKQKMRIALAGKRSGNLNPNYGKVRPLEVKVKISQARMESGVARGKNNPNYRHGNSIANDDDRNFLMTLLPYKIWRMSVFQRDNYTCVDCRCYGGDLQADHIFPWAYYPELRYETSNGRTLCISCHRKRMKDVFLYRSKLQMEGSFASI